MKMSASPVLLDIFGVRGAQAGLYITRNPCNFCPYIFDVPVYTLTYNSSYSVPEFKCLDKKEILKIADVLQEVCKLYVITVTFD